MNSCLMRSLRCRPGPTPCSAASPIYVGDKVGDKVQDKIVLILRDKRDQTADNGVWLATTEEHHQSLRREFPNMRSIQVLGKKVTGWQVLPADARGFRASGAARLRTRSRRGSSNREGAGGTASQGIGEQEGGEILEAGEGTSALLRLAPRPSLPCASKISQS